MAVKIKHKRGTAANIGSANPTLASGELGFETDTLRFKLGDGTTAWDSLAYVKPYVSTTDRLLGRSTAGAGVVEEITCTAFGRSLIDDADAAAARTTLGAAPTASPTFTGTVSAAAVTLSGVLVVPSGDTSIKGSGSGAGNWLGICGDAAGFGTGPAIIMRSAGAGGSTEFYYGSSQGVIINSSRQLLVTAGSASAPGVAVSGDTNTGMYSPGADQLAFSTNQTERMRIDASGNVGIGLGGAPNARLQINLGDVAPAASGNMNTGVVFQSNGASRAINIGTDNTAGYSWINAAFANNSGIADELRLMTGATTRLTISSSGVSTFAGQLLVTAGSASACGVAFSGDPDTGIAQLSAAGADTLSICTNSAERVRVGSGGNVAIGAIDPQTALHIDKNADGALVILRGAQTANTQHILFRNPFHTNNGSAGTAFVGAQDTGASGGTLIFATTTNGSGASGTPTERMRIDASGNVGIGTSSPGGKLEVAGGQLLVTAGSASAPGVAISGDPNTGMFSPSADVLAWATAGSERVRVDASGNVLVGQSTTTDPAGTNTNGIAIAPDYISISRSANACFAVNRKVDDGLVVAVFQDGALEGSISVSGNTVSYNAFCGSHWAQLIDGSRPAILRGTVLETIDEMCEWPDGKSDRLPRVKVSDTPRSRRVYGVFMAWDEDYASTGDMYATALGAYMVRVSGVVQSGDLLESAGDGTARTQSDDIVRSSTIGKVSSTHRVAEYDDGSYLVPCVLMCG